VRLVIGLTGPNAAGKGEVASYLERKGFRIHSLSDIVREAAAASGLSAEREHLIRIGNELRRDAGAGILAQRILPRLGDRDVVDSIRNPAEVAVLRSVPGFVLVGVRAPAELRFQRSLGRARAGDPGTLERFLAREREENAQEPHAQQLEATFRLADHVVENNGGLDRLHRRIDAILDACGAR
jgi:dephospho-CoA kinase